MIFRIIMYKDKIIVKHDFFIKDSNIDGRLT